MISIAVVRVFMFGTRQLFTLPLPVRFINWRANSCIQNAQYKIPNPFNFSDNSWAMELLKSHPVSSVESQFYFNTYIRVLYLSS
jgi:hypothetical protein